MKKLLLTMVQFVCFLVAFAYGSFFPPFSLEQRLAANSDGPRVFIWDGVVLMVVLFVVILLIEAARRRIRTAAPWTALALVLATVAGVALKFGFKTVVAVYINR